MLLFPCREQPVSHHHVFSLFTLQKPQLFVSTNFLTFWIILRFTIGRLCIYREALLITSLNSSQFFIPLSLVLVQDWSPDDWSHWTKFLLSPENDLESVTVAIIQAKKQNMKKQNTCHQKGWGQSLIMFHKARIENALLCNNTCLWIMVGSLHPGFSYLISNYN